MSIQIAYRDGVFKPLEEVADAEPGAIYTAFSKEELRDFIETVGWLKACLLYTSPSPRDRTRSRMPSSA